ncbi:MAG: type IX secretion system sortase PorU, partial [Crocinitomicaceae bacterium]|nr:type IX secretion system sortase PorU [Crocinitomicaceae bacterium]
MKLEKRIFNNKIACVVVTFFMLTGYTLSQGEEVVVIQWGEDKVFTQGNNSITAPVILGQDFIGQTPSFFWSKKVENSNLFTVTATLLSTVPASKIDEPYLSSNYVEVDEFSVDVALSNARNEAYVVMNLMPFVRENGVLKRITSVKVMFSESVPVQHQFQKGFVANSVLRSGSGSWYKISVSRDGVHKIDKEFLEACGIDVASVSPDDINVFGNGDGRLPESNSTPRTDDLAKNAIKIVGGDDGVFNDDDYILFHAWGPHRWRDEGVKFNQDRNPYSDVSCYFINVNSGDTPLRIDEVSNSNNPVTHNVSEYDYFTVYEKDNTSLVNGGQRWYGELFDEDLNQSFDFGIPDVIPSVPAVFEVSIASSSNSSFGTSQTYSIGGTTLFSSPLPTGSDYGRSVSLMTYNTPSSFMTLDVLITRNTPDALTYLDRILLNLRRGLVFTGDQIEFRDLNSVGAGNVAEYSLANLPTASGFVWEVTDRHTPFIVPGAFVGGNYVFQSDADSLRSFVASDGVDFLTPLRVGAVSSQNLHALEPADYLIVTNKNFLFQANRLAALHRENGLIVHVVTSEQVFNEFSSGMLDATAIRSFAKMFYDRSVLSPEDRPKSLLIFGDGTYDPKNRVPNNNNFMLTYQVENSENHIAALVTDDYFGMLDDTDSFLASDLLDIGIGRLLISDNTMAKQQVDKVEHYMKNGSNLYTTSTTNCGSDNGSSTFGDWRTRYVQIADDEEFQFIGEDCEVQYDSVTSNYPAMNCDKIYLDAFQQISTAGGERYPEVNSAINNRIDRGALVVNYVGHGGEVGVAEERVITVPQIQGWKNIDRMPLLVSATCEFTKYDDPDRVSAGEWASINPYGAAIALMTTTRSVYYSVNEATGKAFYANVFERDADLKPRTFGEIIMRTKNEAGFSNNKRSFTLIGDPALQIALPEMNIVTDSINGFAVGVVTDTLKALSKVTIKG